MPQYLPNVAHISDIIRLGVKNKNNEKAMLKDGARRIYTICIISNIRFGDRMYVKKNGFIH